MAPPRSVGSTHPQRQVLIQTDAQKKVHPTLHEHRIHPPQPTMSRYEWEHGSLIIPPRDWSKLKETVQAAHNKMQDAAFLYATHLYDELLARAQGKRDFDFYTEAEQILYSARTQPIPSQSAALRAAWSAALRTGVDDYDVLYALFPPTLGLPQNRRPTQPERKDFPLANPETRKFNLRHEASITFSSDEEHTVTWDVGENNHAIENAHRIPLARIFWQAVSRIQWTQGSGGTLSGNNEYHRGSRTEESGANYVTRRYGPLG